MLGVASLVFCVFRGCDWPRVRQIFRGVSGIKIVPALSVVKRLYKEVSLGIFSTCAKQKEGGWTLALVDPEVVARWGPVRQYLPVIECREYCWLEGSDF